MDNDLLTVVCVALGSFTAMFYERLIKGTVIDQKSAWKKALHKLLK